MGRAQGGDGWLSRALPAAGRCMDVVRSCGDGELWWDASGPGPFVPASAVPAQCGRRLWRGAKFLCPVHPNAPSLPGTPSSRQGDPAPAAPMSLALPRGALLGASPWAALAKPTVPSSPGSTLGCKSQFWSKLGDLLQDQTKGGDKGRGVPIEASPPHVPARLPLPSCKHRLQQLQQGGGSGEDAQGPGTLFFRKGKELEGSVKA